MNAAYRSSCRGQVTKLCNSITEYLTKINFAEPLQDADLVEMEIVSYLDRLKNAHNNLRKADEKASESMKLDDAEKEYNTIIEYDDKAVSVISKLEHILRTKFRFQTQNTTSDERQDNHNLTSCGVGNNAYSGIKLKSFELKKFDGALENWLPFWEQYRRAVHENPQFNSATKFNYLSNALVGPAAATIAGFSPTEKCYIDAISLLLEEYGNSEKIVEKYIQKMMSIKPVSSPTDIGKLRHLYNETTTTMRSLHALQVPSAQYNIVLRSVLLKAISTQLRIQFHRYQKRKAPLEEKDDDSADSVLSASSDVDGDDRLKDLMSFLKSEVEALEISQLSESVSGNPKIYEKPSHPKQFNGRSTATGLFTQSKSAENCVFCNNSTHKTKDCDAKIPIHKKKEILQKQARCFRCSKPNHSSKFCRNQWIKCSHCNGRHLSSMCERKNGNALMIEKTANAEEKTVLVAVDETEIYLQTAKAIISGPEENAARLLTRLVMDNGSQQTYITEILRKKLNLPIVGVKYVNIIPFGDKRKRRAKKCNQIQVAVKSQYNSGVVNIIALEVPLICADILPVPESDNKILKGLRLADIVVSMENYLSGINLLIGQDNYWKFNKAEITYLANDLAAVETFFGWTVQGKSECKQDSENNRSCSFLVSGNYEFDVSNFWKLEQVGVINSAAEDSDLKICDTVSKIKKNEEGRYEASVPWKNAQLSDNKSVAMQRLQGLLRRLMKNSEKLDNYDKGIRELLDTGVAEDAPIRITSDRLYYMPHKAVYREDKTTTKQRIVFDASANEEGCYSLNDCLYAGKNLIPDLTSMLLSFRSNKIALVSDIEKAFLQISLAEEDRDSHRFLWYEEKPAINKSLPRIKEYRMKRLTFGVTCSPFLLAATIQKQLEECEPKYGTICKKLSKSFYIDDLVLSVDSLELGRQIFHESLNIMKEAKMNLRKWNSNDLKLRKEFVENGLEPVIEQKVLGISWNTHSDEIGVDVEAQLEFIRSLRGTKRNVMRAMARIYDPLGFLGPFTVRIKILLQDIWKINSDWDEMLSGEVLAAWLVWQEELAGLSDYSVQRCVSPNLDGINIERQLHVFADASPKAYGAVAYIRSKSNDGVKISFICSKNRVSPLNKNKSGELTLPKLELTSALIAARLKEFLIKSLDFKIDTIHLWTDSTIALHWIMGQSVKSNTYVNNRVEEINKISNIYDWGHCSGKENPADLLTRGISAKFLKSSQLWRGGPAWLKEDSSSWPLKIIQENSFVLQCSETFDTSEDKEASDSETNTSILNLNNFSSMIRLLRVTAYVLRFLNRVKKQPHYSGELTAEEVYEAKLYWIKYCQNLDFSSEIKCLKQGNPISRNSTILSLNPFLHHGILRLRERLPETEYDFNVCNPIILAKTSHLSRLLVLETHGRMHHSGPSAVLAKIREEYWIIRGRQLIKTILRHCVICKRLHGKSASEPWAPLPRERVMTSRPFETVGVDFAGPLYINTQKEGKEKQKVYIMLLTCAAIRAVHLELVPDLTVKSCIQALRRFFARRGVAKVIISDNAKTFKRTDLELRKLEELLKKAEVQGLASSVGVSWRYIAERAAWWGGFYERLVRSVKSALKAAVGKLTLDQEELATLLTEIEATVNSRPLTYISDDSNDPFPLTPSHFLNNAKCLLFSDFLSDKSTIAESWKIHQSLLKRYIKRWQQEYLQQLRTIHQIKDGHSKSVKPEDVVLVHENNKPRLHWKLTVVQTTFPGRDGRIRACEVRLSDRKTLRRPIQLLFPLEISASHCGAQDEERKLIW